MGGSGEKGPTEMTKIYTDGVDRDGAGGGILCRRL